MRVQVAKRRDESGAVAILVAMFAVLTLVLSAFVVDFGMAYVSKRQLATASDAGALAAVRVYADKYRGTCDSTFINSHRGAAQAAANELGAQNWPDDSTPASIDVKCVSGGLEVTYGAQKQIRTTLGNFAGVESIDTSGRAAATLKGVAKAGGLRPWGICSGVMNTSETVTFVPLKDGSTADSGYPCGTTSPPGGWWVAQCTNQSNANGATEEAVLEGCPTPTYQPVPHQPTNPSQRSTYLRDYCDKKSENSTCLASDTGKNFHNSYDEWETLVGQTFDMPVFCFPPQCAPAAFSGTGGTASYAIAAIATVEICGMKLEHHAASGGWPTSGKCATANPKGYTSNSVKSGSGLFVVIKELVGSTTWKGSEATLSSVALSR